MTTLVNLPQNAAQKEVIITQNFNSVSPAGIFSLKNSTTTGLTFGYFGGVYRNSAGAEITIADGTITLTNTAINYVELNTTTNAVAVNTTGPTTGFVPIAQITTAGGVITNFLDKRVSYFLPNGSGSTAPGLTNFTDTKDTASPNNTVNTSILTAIGATTDVDLVLRKKGNGAIIAQNPDGAITAGNKRGSNAVDLQTNRTGAATKVASGTQSVICGGQNNTASGTTSACLAGTDNLSSGTASVVCGGSANQATADYASVLGGGGGNIANSKYSSIPGGSGGRTNGIEGAMVFGGAFPSAGGQWGIYNVGCQTSNATPKRAVANASASSVSNNLTLVNNSSYYIKGQCVARDTATGNTKTWRVEATIKRGANAASTALVGAATVTVINNDAGAAAWTIALTADTTLGCLAVDVTGAAATTIGWLCILETVELPF